MTPVAAPDRERRANEVGLTLSTACVPPRPGYELMASRLGPVLGSLLVG